MKDITIKRIDVFTTNPFGGNPAGVIIDMERSRIGQIQAIAAEMRMNLIELAYITRADSIEADFQIRFYTPDKELEFSGHVALAACYALIEEGMILLNEGLTTAVFESKIGIVPLDIFFSRDSREAEDGSEGIFIDKGSNANGTLKKIMMQQPLYTFRDSSVQAKEIAAVLGIDPLDITSTGLPLVTASNEIDWLIIPVKSKETVYGMHPDLIKLGILNKKHDVWSNHIFTLDTYDPGCITYSRNFSPCMGLWEDPASANGSAGLGAYLKHFGITASDSIVMEQGNEIDSLARMQVEFTMDGGAVRNVRVGGLAVNSIERPLELQVIDS
ncbi:MAG: PhzF family phenazine biosynthesis protein [Candidatus Krumholzibacteriota bacterium]|nr:PhzF family phenazine biosynthesis protein [Candidatus Krumholzibacteriota bacterium]